MTEKSEHHVDDGGPMRRVYLESPYAGDVETNVAFARACVADCLRRGESAYASHLLFTQPGILRDEVPEERALGIAAGQAFRACCDATVVYIDRGWSRGMVAGVEHARSIGQTVELRTLGEREEVAGG